MKRKKMLLLMMVFAVALTMFITTQVAMADPPMDIYCFGPGTDVYNQICNGQGAPCCWFFQGDECVYANGCCAGSCG